VGALRRRRVIHALVVSCGFLPFGALVVGALGDQLGANPVETITHVTGEWALRFLVGTLAVTPLRRIFSWRFLAPYRRSLGLLCFFYALLHFSTYLILDLGLDPSILLEDVLERPYVTAGFTAFVLLVPLAATSTRGMARRLGRHWKTLHRLVYLAGVCAVVHFLWLVKADLREPLVYASVVGLLLALRLGWWLRSSRRRGGLAPAPEEA
jgi:sulfoxide reductase heme-binding subunit YedZ